VTRVYAQLCRLEAIVAGVFLVVMVVMIFIGGVARMAAMPLNWTTDVATCLFAWACFLCADVTWRNNGLMAVELVSGRLAPSAQRLLTWCNYLIICAFLLYVMGAGLWLSWISRARSFQGIPGVSYSWITLSLPVGAALLLITTILKLRDLQRDGAPA
jgi:TRAP-type C4-dicarboxylate transport system permease small subunit